MHTLHCLLWKKTCFSIPLCCYLRRHEQFAFPFLLIDWCDFHLSTALLYLWTHSFLMDIMSRINMKMIFTRHLLVQSITTSTNMKQHGLFSFAPELATWNLCEVRGGWGDWICVAHVLGYLLAGAGVQDDRYFYVSQKSTCCLGNAVDTAGHTKGSKAQLLPSRSWPLSRGVRHWATDKLKKML